MSCRKMRELLSQKVASFEERDFFKEPFSQAEIRELVRGRPLSELFSWRSPTFKAMNMEGQSLTDDELVRLMAQEPRLIRRPLIKVGSQLIIGSDVKALDAVLSCG